MNYSDNEIAKYNEIVNRLRESVLTVTFKKVDGSLRVMKCTDNNRLKCIFELATLLDRKG